METLGCWEVETELQLLDLFFFLFRPFLNLSLLPAYNYTAGSLPDPGSSVLPTCSSHPQDTSPALTLL